MAVDQDKELDLEDLEIEELGSEQPHGGVLSEDDLEQYGVWVKVKPHAVGREVESDLQAAGLEPELPAHDEGPEGDQSLTEEEEQLLGSLEESSSAQALPELEDLGELSIPDEHDAGSLEPDSEHVELELTEQPEPAGRFEDLASLEQELAAQPGAPVGPAPGSGMLQKIEEELAAIRGELAALKSELVNLRRPGAVAETARPVESEREAGFFSDDSDETIALTGDELDNILNTAEITEEEASDQALAEEPAEPGAGGPAGLEVLAEDSLEPLEELSLDEPPKEQEQEPDDGTPRIEAHEISLEMPEEAQGVELELPDVEEIGLDSLEAPDEALAEAPPESAALEEPLEELEIELNDEDLSPPSQAASAKAPLPADEELVLEVPEEAPLEPGEELEALEELEVGDEAQAPAGPAEAVDLEVPEAGDEALEELSLEVPGQAPLEAPIEAAEPLEAEELEEIEAEPLDEVEELAVEQEPAAPPVAPAAVEARPPARGASPAVGAIPGGLKDEIRTVLKYMDQLLEALPDDKIEEFANSEYFEVYRRLFEELEIA